MKSVTMIEQWEPVTNLQFTAYIFILYEFLAAHSSPKYKYVHAENTVAYICKHY